jgi:hypothetical protein
MEIKTQEIKTSLKRKESRENPVKRFLKPHFMKSMVSSSKENIIKGILHS